MAGDQGVIYFIAGLSTDRALVKIGFSDDHPDRRFRAVQAASPVPLFRWGYVPGTRAGEGALHGRFKRWRQHAEWFDVRDDVAVYLMTVRTGWWLERGNETDFEIAVMSCAACFGLPVEAAMRRALGLGAESGEYK